MIIGDLVATNADAMRRRMDRVEDARTRLDDRVFRRSDALGGCSPADVPPLGKHR